LGWHIGRYGFPGIWRGWGHGASGPGPNADRSAGCLVDLDDAPGDRIGSRGPRQHHQVVGAAMRRRSLGEAARAVQV